MKTSALKKHPKKLFSFLLQCCSGDCDGCPWNGKLLCAQFNTSEWWKGQTFQDHRNWNAKQRVHQIACTCMWQTKNDSITCLSVEKPRTQIEVTLPWNCFLFYVWVLTKVQWNWINCGLMRSDKGEKFLSLTMNWWFFQIVVTLCVCDDCKDDLWHLVSTFQISLFFSVNERKSKGPPNWMTTTCDKINWKIRWICAAANIHLKRRSASFVSSQPNGAATEWHWGEKENWTVFVMFQKQQCFHVWVCMIVCLHSRVFAVVPWMSCLSDIRPHGLWMQHCSWMLLKKTTWKKLHKQKMTFYHVDTWIDGKTSYEIQCLGAPRFHKKMLFF